MELQRVQKRLPFQEVGRHPHKITNQPYQNLRDPSARLVAYLALVMAHLTVVQLE